MGKFREKLAATNLLRQIGEPLSGQQVEEAVHEMCNFSLVARSTEQQLSIRDYYQKRAIATTLWA
ncbi:MAG: hypothetical protein K6U75_03110 [Firmicutes bacterium]|nr:hypothetical protein [Bacillota bacterium]